MHLNTKRTLRWLVIAGFGGYGIYTLVEGVLHVSAKPDVHWAAFWFFLFPVMLVSSGLLIAVAYFVLRRQYRHLCTLVSVLAAVIVFGFLISLPDRLGLQERLRTLDDSPWFLLIALPTSLAALLIPFYGARWAYRRGQAILSRFIHDDTPS
jgi:ABC-type branched-subunit amino acid transport system permease subunit